MKLLVASTEPGFDSFPPGEMKGNVHQVMLSLSGSCQDCLGTLYWTFNSQQGAPAVFPMYNL